mgnify:CR=1 FL=1
MTLSRLSLLRRPARRPAALALACLCLLQGHGAALAQPAAAPARDLVEAVHSAARWHPEVHSAAQQVLQAREGIASARSGYLPQVRAGIGSQLSNRDLSSYESRRVHTASLTVTQMLYDFGKVASSVESAEAAEQATQAQAQGAIDTVAREAALAWIEAHRQEALGRIAREQLDGVTALKDLVVERERQGASSRSDVVQALARVAAAQAQVLDAEAQARRARVQLMHLTGGTVVGAAGDTPAWLDQACRASDAQAGSAAVRLARAQRDEAQARVRAARAQQLPTLSLEGSASQGLDSRSRLPGESGPQTTVMLNLAAPLYEGGNHQARERAAAHALRAADADVQRALLEAQQGLAEARAQAQGHALRDPVLAERVESIRTTRDLYRQQYLQLGTRSLLDLLNAEQEYHAARIEQANGRHEQHRLALDCLYHTDRLRSAFGLDTLPEAAEATTTP